MNRKLTDRLVTSLREKRDILTAWLDTTSPKDRQLRLGTATVGAMKAHLEILDQTLEQAEAETIGQCKVCHEPVDSSLLEMDYSCCICLDHYSADEVRQLETDLEMAGQVQLSFLPSEVPQIPGLDISAYSRPAQIIGGDYFDFFSFRDSKPGMVIADVAGHGMSASLHMASVQTLLRTLVPTHTSPAEVIAEVQRLYSHNIRFTTFVTLFLAAYDPDTQTLTYCNAGHNPPLILHQFGPHEPDRTWLQPTGPAVGLVEEASFHQAQVTLQPGDIVILYTDGLPEATNARNEMLGLDRFVSWLIDNPGNSASEALKVIQNRLTKYQKGKPAEDDITLIVSRLETEQSKA